MAGQRWERDQRRVRTVSGEGLAVNVSIDIAAKGIALEQDFRQAPGHVMLCDLSQPSVHESTDGRSIQLVIPRELVKEAGLDIARLHGTSLGSAASHMFASHLINIHNMIEGLPLSEGRRIEQTIMDMLVLAICASGHHEELAVTAMHSTAMMRAQREIEMNLGSSLLTATNLCRKLKVSRSTLHRMFEADGGVQAYIRNARLDAAKSALLAPIGNSRIVDIAERFGFSDSAHFSRLFRDRFGDTPSALKSAELNRRRIES